MADRKRAQSICFGSIFACFGGISIVNWKLALCVGITSLLSERKALIWSAAQQLSALLHSNTAQQLKATRAKHNIPLRLWMTVELLWPAIKCKQPFDFYKNRKLSSRLPFLTRTTSASRNAGIQPHRHYKNYKAARCEHDKSTLWPCLAKPLPHVDLTGGKRSSPVSVIVSWWPVWSTLPSPVASGLFAPLVLSQDWFFFFTEVKSKNMTVFLVSVKFYWGSRSWASCLSDLRRALGRVVCCPWYDEVIFRGSPCTDDLLIALEDFK